MARLDGYVPRDDGVTRVANRTEGAAKLPAGPALVVALSVGPGTASESRAVVYAIETEDGIAILRVVGAPSVLDERADDIRLMTMLAEFGAASSGR